MTCQKCRKIISNIKETYTGDPKEIKNALKPLKTGITIDKPFLVYVLVSKIDAGEYVVNEVKDVSLWKDHFRCKNQKITKVVKMQVVPICSKKK